MNFFQQDGVQFHAPASTSSVEPVRRLGPVIGHYKDHPIHDVIEIDGVPHRYDRIAVEISRDMFNPEQLGLDEVLLQPGLIYACAA